MQPTEETMLTKINNVHETLLDNLNGAVLLTDLDLSISYANSAAESLFQIARSKLCSISVFELLEDKVGCSKTLSDLVDSGTCLLYTSPSPRDGLLSRMPSSA